MLVRIIQTEFCDSSSGTEELETGKNDKCRIWFDGKPRGRESFSGEW